MANIFKKIFGLEKRDLEIARLNEIMGEREKEIKDHLYEIKRLNRNLNMADEKLIQEKGVAAERVKELTESNRESIKEFNIRLTERGAEVKKLNELLKDLRKDLEQSRQALTEKEHRLNWMTENLSQERLKNGAAANELHSLKKEIGVLTQERNNTVASLNRELSSMKELIEDRIYLESQLKKIGETAELSFNAVSKVIEVVPKVEETIPPVSVAHIQLSNKAGAIDFRLDNNFQLDNSWKLLSASSKAGNIFSQISGASSMAGTAAYSAHGMYTATASVNSLMTYADGTLSSITMDGAKFGKHAGFVSANAAVFTPLLVFQFTSMLTGQYYFKGLSKELLSIKNIINQLVSLHHNERLAKLRYIATKLYELNKRSYFTTEDFVTVDNLKYELSTIRFEYLLIAGQELLKVLGVTEENETKKDVNIVSKDAKWAERFLYSVKEDAKKASNEAKRFFRNLLGEMNLKGGGDKIQKLTENSSKKAINLTDGVINSNYFFYSKTSLNAEYLFQLSKMVEFRMNLADNEPGQNRIGKIKELYNAILSPHFEDSVFDEIESLHNQIREILDLDISKFHENSVLHKTKIEAASEKLKNELENTTKLVAHKDKLQDHIGGVKKSFEKPNRILIDNRGNETLIYIRDESE